MDTKLQKKIVRVATGILIFQLLALSVSVYLVSILGGYLDYPSIYLSDAFQEDPARAIAAFILPQLAILATGVSGRHLFYIRRIILTDNKKNLTLWKTSVGLLVCMFYGFLGVGAVSIDTLDELHWFAATLLFGGGVFFIITLTRFDFLLRLEMPYRLQNLRIGLSVLCLAMVFTFGFTIAVSTLASGISELTVAALFLGYFITLAHDCYFPIRQKTVSVRSSNGAFN
jgi:hypothetical protein